MKKDKKNHRTSSGDAEYEASLRELQIELVKLQRHVIKHGP
jgi:polyphosphate kinase 2 (PPK2 family)